MKFPVHALETIELTEDSEKKEIIDIMNSLGGLREQETPRFMWPQPASITAESSLKLFDTEYMVSHKPDGYRYVLMCIDIQGTKLSFFIDRKLHIFSVDLPIAGDDVHRGSIFDGELVQSHDGEWSFLIFDVMAFGGRCVTKKNFLERIYCAKKVSMKCSPDYPLLIGYKHFEPFYNLRNLVHNTHLTHDIDGFVFISVRNPVKLNTDWDMLKVKPLTKNSIDFQVKKQGRNYVMYIGNRDAEDGLEEYKIVKPARKFLRELDYKSGQPVIVECLYDLKTNDFEPHSHRIDKHQPNSVMTLNGTLKTIKDNITIEYLVEKSKSAEKWDPRDFTRPAGTRLRDSSKDRPRDLPRERPRERSSTQTTTPFLKFVNEQLPNTLNTFLQEIAKDPSQPFPEMELRIGSIPAKTGKFNAQIPSFIFYKVKNLFSQHLPPGLYMEDSNMVDYFDGPTRYTEFVYSDSSPREIYKTQKKTHSNTTYNLTRQDLFRTVCRISCAAETSEPSSPEELAAANIRYTRKKERTSFKSEDLSRGGFSIDFTKVITKTDQPPIYEIEIEYIPDPLGSPSNPKYIAEMFMRYSCMLIRMINETYQKHPLPPIIPEKTDVATSN
uniref:Uncharacterized protein n=1 Tax=viral metagenome TaxID=1070528 RepID=A0A6C0CJ15_9ZZZZ